jgi:hypothetical protein
MRKHKRFLVSTKATKGTECTAKPLSTRTAPRLKHEQGNKSSKPPKRKFERIVAWQALDMVSIVKHQPLTSSGLGGFVFL